MLNRKQQPNTPPSPALRVPKIEQRILGQDVPLFIHASPDTPLVSLSLWLPAGDWYASQAGLTCLTARMLTRGTQTKDRNAIASAIDYCGAWLGCTAMRDKMKVDLISPPAQMEELLPLFAEVVQEATFPEEAFSILKPTILEEIKQKEANPQTVGAQHLRERIFGEQHPYGYTLRAEGLEQLTVKELRQHHALHGKCPTEVSIGGAVTEGMLERLQACFKNLSTAGKESQKEIKPSTGGSWEIQRKGSVQSVICMGHPTITLSHPDYPALYVTNALLGGFFGSRLMTNLREDKGYTYGVHTSIEAMRHAGYWSLETSVKKEHTQAACEEIRKEIDRLQTTHVGEEELLLLKNYLFGSLLESLDGSSAIRRSLHATLLHEKDLTFFAKLYATVRDIDAATIQAMAKKYLAPSSLGEVIVRD